MSRNLFSLGLGSFGTNAGSVLNPRQRVPSTLRPYRPILQTPIAAAPAVGCRMRVTTVSQGRHTDSRKIFSLETSVLHQLWSASHFHLRLPEAYDFQKQQEEHRDQYDRNGG